MSSVLVSSADNLCKEFGPRSGLTKRFARMRAFTVSYQPSLLEKKVLYFYALISVRSSARFFIGKP